MTKSEMTKLLGNAASALKSLQKSAPSDASNASDPQLKIDILQVILQILQAIAAQQGQSASAELTPDDANLLVAVTSILDSLKQDLRTGSNAHAEPIVQVAGLQIDILQLIIQIIAAILNQQKPAPAPVSAASDLALSSEAIQPRVTSDSVTYQYDTRGRLLKLTYGNGTTTVVFNYDSVGNRTSVVTTL